MDIPYIKLVSGSSRQKHVCIAPYDGGSVPSLLNKLLATFQVPPLATYAAVVDTEKAVLWTYFEFGCKVPRAYVDKGLCNLFSEYTLHGASTRALAAMLSMRNAFFTGAAASCKPMPITARLAQHVARSASVFACETCNTLHATPCFTCPEHMRVVCRDASGDAAILNGLARYMLGHLASAANRPLNAWEKRWRADVTAWAAVNGHPAALAELIRKLRVPKSKVDNPQPGPSPYRIAEIQIKTARAVHAIAMDTYCRTSKVCVGCGHTVCHKCPDKHVCTLKHTTSINQFVQRHDMLDIDAGCPVSLSMLQVKLPHLRFPDGVRSVAGVQTYSTKALAYCESMKLLRTVGDYIVVRHNFQGREQHLIVVCGVARMLVDFSSFSSPMHHAALRSHFSSLYTATQHTLCDTGV